MASEDGYDSELERLEKLEELVAVQKEYSEKHGKELEAEERRIKANIELIELMAPRLADSQPAITAIGRVTVNEDIYGTKIKALEEEIAAKESEVKALRPETEALYQKMKVLEDWLEENDDEFTAEDRNTEKDDTQ